MNWTVYVHADGEYLSINDGTHGDTLLKMPEGDADRERVRQFAAAVSEGQGQLREAVNELLTALSFLSLRDQLGHGKRSMNEGWETTRVAAEKVDAILKADAASCTPVEGEGAG